MRRGDLAPIGSANFNLRTRPDFGIFLGRFNVSATLVDLRLGGIGASLARSTTGRFDMSTLTSRLVGSALLDAQSYEEIESDRHANLQAFAVVVLSSIAAALGTGFKDVGSTIGLVFVAVVSWIIWVLLTLIIGTQLLPGKQTKADFGQVFRTTGFSASPGMLRILGLVPGIGSLLFGAATVWMLFSFVVAVRQALDYESTGRALAVCLLGWIIHGLLFFGFVMTAF